MEDQTPKNLILLYVRHRETNTKLGLHSLNAINQEEIDPKQGYLLSELACYTYNGADWSVNVCLIHVTRPSTVPPKCRGMSRRINNSNWQPFSDMISDDTCMLAVNGGVNPAIFVTLGPAVF